MEINEKEEDQFRQVVEMSPTAMVMINQSGDIRLANLQMEKIFGYPRSELLGRSIDMLLPERFRGNHYHQRNDFFSSPGPRTMGSNRDLSGLRSDGTEFPLEIGLNPIATMTGLKVLAAIVDISERKKTEMQLQESERSLRNLNIALEHLVEERTAELESTSHLLSQSQEKLSRSEERAMFSTLIDGTPSYIHVRDLNGRYIYVNREYEKVFQCKREEILGKHYSTVLPSETAALVEANERQLICTKTAFQTETPIDRPDGRHIYLVSRSPLNNERGEIIGTVGVGIDITKMKELELNAERTLSSLKASEERWSFALEGAGEGVWDWNMVTNKVQYSKRWKEMIGFKEDEISDSLEEWSSRVHPDDLPNVMTDVTANIEGKTVSFSNEHRFRQKDGTYKWIHDRGMVVERDASGCPTRMVGTHSDISERKKMDLIKSEFISTVSHELRTPLTSIRGALGLLEAGTMGDIPPKALEVLKIANKNSQRLILLVNDILDMEKLLSGKMKFSIEPIRLDTFLHQAIESNTAYAINYGVQYQLLNFEEVTVLADSNRLLQVMTNIMSNAAKFSKNGSSVEIGYLRREQFIRVSVIDHGVGIPDEFQSQIFGAFSQANNTDSRKYGGTGLGLHISKKLMNEMGGGMGYVSKLGVGSTFWIDLVTPR